MSPAGGSEGRLPDGEEWRALAVGRGSAFMLPEWFEASLEHYAEGSPEVVVDRAPDGSLRGVLPLLRRGRGLRFAGAALGDSFGPVATKEDEDRVAVATAELLGRRDYLVLDHVERGASWPLALGAAARGRLLRASTRTDVMPAIDLDGLDWEGFLAGCSRNLRSQVRSKERRLQREHDLRYRRTRDEAELDRDMSTFFRLHDERWQGRGGSSSSTTRSRAFHRDVAAALLLRGWLRLWFLELDGAAAAAWYGWHIGGRYAYYLAGFSPRWQEQSVGFVLLAHTIREALAEGAAEYDMLRGDEAYKSRFATRRREVETIVLARPRSAPRAIARLEAMAWHGSRGMPAGVRAAGRRAHEAAGRLMPTSHRR